MFVALGACAFVLIPVEYFLFGLAGGKLMERVRSLTFQSLMCQEINWFDKPEHSRCVGFFILIIFFKTIKV
jgi:ATP-binding cassette, subfamily B (MDR/TAP), member 1